MIRDLRIAVIGAGVMGEAMIGGLLKQDLVAPEQIVATEPRSERRVEIEAPEDDPLAGFAGSHRGLLVSGLKLVVDPARHPTGLTATLRAPLRAPEPALSLGGRNGHRGD